MLDFSLLLELNFPVRFLTLITPHWCRHGATKQSKCPSLGLDKGRTWERWVSMGPQDSSGPSRWEDTISNLSYREDDYTSDYKSNRGAEMPNKGKMKWSERQDATMRFHSDFPRAHQIRYIHNHITTTSCFCQPCPVHWYWLLDGSYRKRRVCIDTCLLFLLLPFCKVHCDFSHISPSQSCDWVQQLSFLA